LLTFLFLKSALMAGAWLNQSHIDYCATFS
jgi:hypothetical protein